MANDSSTNEPTTFDNFEVPIPRLVRFWLLLLVDIPALGCTLFLLFHLLFKRTLRKALNNHVIIILLILALTSHIIDVPSYITFVHLGYVWLASPGFCSFWSFVDIGLFNMIVLVMAFGAIERHILVFHSAWIRTIKGRLPLHYIPFATIIIYCGLFYVVVIFFPPCENVFDYTQPWCSYPCYYDNTILAIYDSVMHGILHALVNAIFSIALLLRHIHQKHRMRQVLRWRNHRKMTIQMLLISTLHIIFEMPLSFLTIAHLCGMPAEIGTDAQLYLYFFLYFITLLLPFVCLAALPEIWKKLSIHLPRWVKNQLRRTATVLPVGDQNGL